MKSKKSFIAKLLSIFKGKVYYVNGADTLPPPLTKQEETSVFMDPLKKPLRFLAFRISSMSII